MFISNACEKKGTLQKNIDKTTRTLTKKNVTKPFEANSAQKHHT